MNLIDRLLYKIFNVERTYSQCGEDKIMSLMFNSFGKERISYLDIGTNDPVRGNNTYLFYTRGGNGVCVEPNPGLSELIKKTRPRDKCLKIGLGVTEDSDASFYVMSAPTLSTFSEQDALVLDAAGKYTIKEVLKVPVKNINSIIQENFAEPIDLVSIDVEGWNEEIVRSFDFTKYRPFCFCVETITFSETGNGKKLGGILEVFLENEYSVYADTHINTIFIKDR